MVTKTAQALWEDYLFLTEEMRKFLVKQEMELFNNLLKQRDQLQSVIDKTADNGFKTSLEGQQLFKKVQDLNQIITNKMGYLVSGSRRQHQVAEVYNTASTTTISRLNWQR